MQTNNPEQWKHLLKQPCAEDHKYSRGMAVVYGAPEMTGATRLAASACARMGCGYVCVLCTDATYDIYRTTLPAYIVVRNDLDFSDERVNAFLVGPGGVPDGLRSFDCGIPAVLDAAALSKIPDKLSTDIVLTPHEGEFMYAFPDLSGERHERAIAAAKQKNCIIVLKGSETVIAHPDGRVCINKNAPSNLATAGSGDVLSGMITGLLATGVPPFEASCAAVWMHTSCALNKGAGMVASDLIDEIPQILRDFA